MPFVVWFITVLSCAARARFSSASAAGMDQSFEYLCKGAVTRKSGEYDPDLRPRRRKTGFDNTELARWPRQKKGMCPFYERCLHLRFPMDTFPLCRDGSNSLARDGRHNEPVEEARVVAAQQRSASKSSFRSGNAAQRPFVFVEGRTVRSRLFGIHRGPASRRMWLEMNEIPPAHR